MIDRRLDVPGPALQVCSSGESLGGDFDWLGGESQWKIWLARDLNFTLLDPKADALSLVLYGPVNEA